MYIRIFIGWGLTIIIQMNTCYTVDNTRSETLHGAFTRGAAACALSLSGLDYPDWTGLCQCGKARHPMPAEYVWVS